MSEKQKQTMEKLAENIGNWDAEQRGYLLGYIEGISQAQQKQEEKESEQKGA